jgi:anaphase-promoting complex subunit 8
MAKEPLKLDLKEAKLDLQKAIVECSQRGLLHSTKW